MHLWVVPVEPAGRLPWSLYKPLHCSASLPSHTICKHKLPVTAAARAHQLLLYMQAVKTTPCGDGTPAERYFERCYTQDASAVRMAALALRLNRFRMIRSCSRAVPAKMHFRQLLPWAFTTRASSCAGPGRSRCC